MGNRITAHSHPILSSSPSLSTFPSQHRTEGEKALQTGEQKREREIQNHWHKDGPRAGQHGKREKGEEGGVGGGMS